VSWLCRFGIHHWVGMCGYCIQPFPGVRMCFHKDVCARCDRVRERMYKPLSKGDEVEFAMQNPELAQLVEDIWEDK